MGKWMSLTKRNCLVFLRDRSAVFFSLLSMLIVLLLMVVFLGDMNVDSVVQILKEYGGERNVVQDEENAKHLVQYWTLAGILVVNSVTVTLSVMGTMVTDGVQGRLVSLYSAPVSRSMIACSYVSAAIMIGFFMCTLTLGVALVLIGVAGGGMLSVGAILKIELLILLNVCIFAVVMYLAALFVRSSSAWGGIGTVVGTLVGFVGTIYIPAGALPEGVMNVLKYIPILHGTALMREVCCEEILGKTFVNIPPQVAENVVDYYKEYMGIQVKMGENIVSAPYQILFLVGCGIMAFIVSVWVQKRQDIRDR